MSDRPIRVVIADDHALIRAGVRALLGSFDGTELVGEAANGEEAIHRIISEAVTNVVRHAQATNFTVALWSEDGHVVGRVTDDGIGIGPDARPGVGTRSFRDRAEELGGTVTIHPVPTGGTEVRIMLPIGPHE